MENLRQPLRGLQLLAVRGNDFREEFAASSRDIVWLRLWDFNGTIVPPWLSLTNLRALELYNAQNLEELWQHNMKPPLQLRELIIDLTKRTCFQGLPRSIGHLKHLKKIVLNGNGNGMKTLPEEFCHMGSLETLQMSDFLALSSLPDQFGGLKNLRVLIFSGVQLTSLPDSFKQLRLLEFLDISNSQTFFFNSEMLDVLEFMTKLQTLKISHCPQLVELPPLTTLVCLSELDLSYTGLREIPNNISQLTKLKILAIGSDNLTSLPGSLGDLSCLTSLAIYDCDLLKSLPETVRRLSNLQSLKIEDTPILELGLGSRSASACNLFSLKCLSLFNTRVSTISISDYCCPSLEALRLRCNTRLTSISDLPKNVTEIMVHGCEKLWNMMAISDLLNLENLLITDCPKLKVLQIMGPNLRSLPESLGALSCLVSLSIKDCHMLKSLPEALGRLSNLQYLDIYSTPLVDLGLGIGSPSRCNLKSLKSLKLEDTRLRRISISDDCCPSLETLSLWCNDYLTEIQTLPGNVREISVRQCEQLKNMRCIGGLQNLQRLEVVHCPEPGFRSGAMSLYAYNLYYRLSKSCNYEGENCITLHESEKGAQGSISSRDQRFC